MISIRDGSLTVFLLLGRSESAAAHKWPSLQAPPGTRGLRIRPRRHGGAVAAVQYIVRRQHPPAFGRAAPRPAPIGRPRPSKACRPLRSSVYSCLSGASAGRDSTVHHPEHLQQYAPARLAPQVGAAVSPLPSAHILPRRAFLAGVPAGQLRRPATTPTRPTHGQLTRSGTDSTARHSDDGQFQDKNYQGSAAAPPPLWGTIISGISSWVDR